MRSKNCARATVAFAVGLVTGCADRPTEPLPVQAVATRAAAAISYTVTELGTLGGDYSEGAAVGTDGRVVGSSFTASGATRPFLWQNGVMTDLGTLAANPAPYMVSGAMAINARGQIAGTSYTDAGYAHAFRWEKGVMTDLGALDGRVSYAAGIGPSGDVVGNSITGTLVHAFLWTSGTMIDLGTLGGIQSFATAINGRGQVVGGSNTDSGTWHAFLWDAGTMVDLGTLGGAWSRASDISPSGDVVGSSTMADGRSTRSCGSVG